MSVQPNYPNVDSEAYNCAQCYVVANSSSYVPFQHCLEQCKNVSSETRGCIRSEVKANALVLPHNMSCVKSKLNEAQVPKNQCQTLCLATFNQCQNECK